MSTSLNRRALVAGAAALRLPSPSPPLPLNELRSGHSLRRVLINAQIGVRFRGQTGKHLLIARLTGFDPKAALHNDHAKRPRRWTADSCVALFCRPHAGALNSQAAPQGISMCRRGFHVSGETVAPCSSIPA
jgi:hypothetical protein